MDPVPAVDLVPAVDPVPAVDLVRPVDLELPKTAILLCPCYRIGPNSQTQLAAGAIAQRRVPSIALLPAILP